MIEKAKVMEEVQAHDRKKPKPKPKYKFKLQLKPNK